MNLPIKCPICNDILLTKYPPSLIQGECVKYCIKSLSHYFKVNSYKNNHNIIKSIIIKFDLEFFWIWDFELNNLSIFNHKNLDKKTLPFFNPDLCNISKLKNKLKTYLIFL